MRHEMSVGSPEVFLILSEMGQLLGTELDRDSLGFALRLINDKVEPVKLAELLRSWRKNEAERNQGEEGKETKAKDLPEPTAGN